MLDSPFAMAFLEHFVFVRERVSGPGRDRRKARGLLHLLRESRLEVLEDSGLTGLEVLSRLDDPKLNPATEGLIRSLAQPESAPPAALYHAARFFEATGRTDEAARLFRRLADSAFEDDPLTLDACLWMGDHLAGRDDDRARDYYWRAVRIGWQSPGYPRDKVDRAIASLNALDRR